jgi:GNAT superfamily N-acetyltransferase
MDYAIVEASIDDAEAITDVTIRSYEAAFKEPFYMDREAALRRWKAYIRKEHHPQKAKDPRIIFAAVAGGEIVGYIAGHLTERFELDGELQSIYILPERQRQGIGTQLVIELAKWFKTWNATKVCVDAMGGSEGFYIKLGARRNPQGWLVWDNFLDILNQRRKDKT